MIPILEELIVPLIDKPILPLIALFVTLYISFRYVTPSYIVSSGSCLILFNDPLILIALLEVERVSIVPFILIPFALLEHIEVLSLSELSHII